MNRGSSAYAAADAALDDRFNEAPIHESGKSYSTTLPGASQYGFNEAPIHESGKCYRPLLTYVWLGQLQ